METVDEETSDDEDSINLSDTAAEVHRPFIPPPEFEADEVISLIDSDVEDFGDEYPGN